MVNRHLVFDHGRDNPARTTGVRYFSLAALLLAANFGLIWALEGAGLLALPAKILAETILLGISFLVQQRFLFTGKAAKKAAASSPSEPSASTHISG
jgi:putative flippase GtrA